ncbi:MULTISPECIES: MurR/RpiR family transcriptional regulator [Clostridia]|uniref:MurR/RpiR family transcriptional regulator n=1 Tax=Clostridia TaxID=186801 RepID=UPI0023F387F1|nr:MULTISPECIES: MurR/RpiR family transcriptional regulator [Clostridia]MDD4692018.1 MurR/RpiR family transcriptional regulator [Eubacterium aggregans]MEA5004696.1 MurR/RpiR family transcriptional regulator [Christensenella sp.]
MQTEPTILDRIFAGFDGFFEQEKKVATYIMNNPKAVVDITIGELAEASGTSVATISRFCRKCGLEGFHQLKVGLAREIVETDGSVSISNDINRGEIAQSLNNILANKVAELRQTVAMLRPADLEVVLSAIEGAGTVQFVAVGNTIPVALDAAYKLSEIGIRAIAGTIWEAQMAFTLNLRPGDVLVAISNSGESRQVYKMVEAAKAGGVLTVGITNNPQSAIGQAVDIHLQTATREKLFLNEFCFSRVSAMTVIEILYLFLTVGKEESYAKLSRCEHLISDEKL